jgi:hypothetical protein
MTSIEMLSWLLRHRKAHLDSHIKIRNPEYQVPAKDGQGEQS